MPTSHSGRSFAAAAADDPGSKDFLPLEVAATVGDVLRDDRRLLDLHFDLLLHPQDASSDISEASSGRLRSFSRDAYYIAPRQGLLGMLSINLLSPSCSWASDVCCSSWVLAKNGSLWGDLLSRVHIVREKECCTRPKSFRHSLRRVFWTQDHAAGPLAGRSHLPQVYRLRRRQAVSPGASPSPSFSAPGLAEQPEIECDLDDWVAWHIDMTPATHLG